MEAVEHRLDRKVQMTAAMGDSDADLEMLRSANIAYAPMNCSAAVRGLTSVSRKSHLMRSRNQRGLLEAVVDLIERRHHERIDWKSIADVRPSIHLIDRVLDLSSQSEPRQWLRIIRARLTGEQLPGWEPSQ